MKKPRQTEWRGQVKHWGRKTAQREDRRHHDRSATDVKTKLARCLLPTARQLLSRRERAGALSGKSAPILSRQQYRNKYLADVKSLTAA
jgi:hypothetical protein